MPLLQTTDNRSWIDRWRDDGTLGDRINAMTPAQAQEFIYLWEVWARRNQVIPDRMGDEFRVWIFRAGRGSGKTRSGAETCRLMSDKVSRIALVAPTAADVRDVIVEGESGILSVFPPDQRPTYEPSKRRLTFKSGAVAFTYSAEEPERLRGPQHGWAWIDEPASMPSGQAMLDNLLLGLRLGSAPWAMVTGTPKPVKWLRELSDRPDTVTTTGSTFDNERYLAPGFITDVVSRYEGTRLGRQELYAEWLEDVEGALWTQQIIDAGRISSFDLAHPWESLNAWLVAGGQPPRQDRRLWRIVVAVDPPGETAECGIVVAAAPTQGHAGVDHVVILEDASIAGRPETWGAQVASVARKWGAERVVVESNQGGDMTRATISAVDPSLRIEKIHAKVGKAARAEPVSALYERCIAAGEPVWTAEGQKAIEDVGIGEMVWTRNGLRPVTAAWSSGIRELVRIETTAGHALVCSSDHPVYVVGKGFVRAEHLDPTTDRLGAWTNDFIPAVTAEPLHEDSDAGHALRDIGGLLRGNPSDHSSSSWNFGTTKTRRAIGDRAGTVVRASSIEMSGRITTDQSRPDGMSTTLTATLPTTISRIWKPSQPQNISAKDTSAMSEMQRSERKQADNAWHGGRSENPERSSVNCAGWNISQQRPASDSVLLPVMHGIGLRSVVGVGLGIVHDLSVDGTPEFFASGLLVHNCLVHHVGFFPKLEEQQSTWVVGDKSPDRLDALVHAVSTLVTVQAKVQASVRSVANRRLPG